MDRHFSSYQPRILDRSYVLYSRCLFLLGLDLFRNPHCGKFFIVIQYFPNFKLNFFFKIGSFFALNLCLVVIANHFQEAKQKQAMERAESGATPLSLYGQIIELLIDSCKQCIKRIRHPKQQQKGTGAIDRSNHQETSVVIENVESTSNCYDISLSVNDFEIGKNQSIKIDFDF